MTDIIRMTTNFVDSCMRGKCGADKYGNYTSSPRLFKRWILGVGGGGEVLLGNLGRGVPAGSPNPDLISDQRCNFPHPFSDKISKIHTRFQTWLQLFKRWIALFIG